ncbi:sulfurtransferase [Mycolicibacterium duvalii]|uniref:Sulfurtransferase n=1 Tax=Mycolicibacterium duvalii TaxID=39688 RepID=A0A7I7K6H6_9MYCO|nr:rhodanese-like domain-containing protein [Mycolicibacterium duvalii]MCV7368046.1 rhodanese-like domain-containing protein [Mycolicibacterium duvalii]PEG35034.1 sulfurtransferase [Mycolicibacterium duvalii]BBX19696.1 sulfurtransferase [Mycolicibacterium duvalii]
MDGPDETGVVQAQIGEVPTDFGASVTLLDVREVDEWQRGHAPGARHMPMGEVPARLDEIDRDAQLFVICHVGGRSHRVAQYLAQRGFEPINVAGGMLAWAGAGRAVVTDDGVAGTV